MSVKQDDEYDFAVLKNNNNQTQWHCIGRSVTVYLTVLMGFEVFFLCVETKRSSLITILMAKIVKQVYCVFFFLGLFILFCFLFVFVFSQRTFVRIRNNTLYSTLLQGISVAGTKNSLVYIAWLDFSFKKKTCFFARFNLSLFVISSS